MSEGLVAPEVKPKRVEDAQCWIGTCLNSVGGDCATCLPGYTRYFHRLAVG